MNLSQDIRYAVRQFRRNPGFTLVAVLTLALGNGANTSVFTVLNGLLLKMLPVKDPQQLAVVGDPTQASSRSNGTPRTDVFSYPLYKEMRDRNSVFKRLCAGATDHHIEVDSGNSQFPDQKINGRMVSGNYFSVLGVQPAAGTPPRRWLTTPPRTPIPLSCLVMTTGSGNSLGLCRSSTTIFASMGFRSPSSASLPPDSTATWLASRWLCLCL